MIGDDTPASPPDGARIRRLDGASATETVRAQVRTAIIRGDLHPGQAVSLAVLAERHRVTVSALATTLAGLEAEHLLTVRGDTAYVAPLSPANLLASQRFGTVFAGSLIPRAFELITPAHLARVEDLMLVREQPGTERLDYAEDVVRQGALAIATLYAPACTPSDRRELGELLDHGSRYSFFAGEILAEGRLASARDYGDAQREVLELLRAGRPEAAARQQLALFRRLHTFERLSLDFPRRTEGDSPLAEVIPLRRIS